MEYGEIIDISRLAIFTLMKISAPILVLSLVVGLLISLFQALTQIQETTLSFVPKIMAVFLSLIIFMPYILDQMQVLMDKINAFMIGA